MNDKAILMKAQGYIYIYPKIKTHRYKCREKSIQAGIIKASLYNNATKLYICLQKYILNQYGCYSFVSWKNEYFHAFCCIGYGGDFNILL